MLFLWGRCIPHSPLLSLGHFQYFPCWCAHREIQFGYSLSKPPFRCAEFWQTFRAVSLCGLDSGLCPFSLWRCRCSMCLCLCLWF